MPDLAVVKPFFDVELFAVHLFVRLAARVLAGNVNPFALLNTNLKIIRAAQGLSRLIALIAGNEVRTALCDPVALG